MIHLLDLIFPPRVDEIQLRDTPPDAFLALLTPALVPGTRPEAVGLFPFHHPVIRAALHEAKYHGSRRAFQYLGLALAESLQNLDENYGYHAAMTLVPVPLGKNRQKERGFNQVEEVIRAALPHLIASGTYTLNTHTIERVRDTVSQVSLPREQREENMRGAFRARDVDPTVTYMLIDDVLTTGATLQAAIDALESAGARSIIPLALAH